MSTVTTFTGNLAGDPELRFTTGGKAVVEFRVAVNRRTKDITDQWVDAEPTFHNVKVWGQRAENIAESCTKGTRVNVHGHVETDAWTKDGVKHTKDIVVITDRFGFVGADLAFASVEIRKTTRHTPQEQPATGTDPWATPATE